jgi:PGF-pre-PGF domain-containing protein
MNRYFLFFIIAFACPFAFADAVSNAGNSQIVDLGDTVYFDGSSSSCSGCTIVNYIWQFGDGMSTNGVTADHVYSESGVYSVVLVTIGSDGSVDSDSMEVTVNNQDAVSPVITHTNITRASRDQDVIISAIVTDNVGIALVRLYYGSDASSSEGLISFVDMIANGDTYSGTIPSEYISLLGFRYYIKAQDESDNTNHYPLTAPVDTVSVSNITVNDTLAPITSLISISGKVVSPVYDAIGDGKTLVEIQGERGMNCRWSTNNDTSYDLMQYDCTVVSSRAYCNVTSYLDGNYSAYISCKDQSDNQQLAEDNLDINFIVDSTKPVINSFSGVSSNYRVAHITWNVADLGSGVDSVIIYRSLDNRTFTSITTTSSSSGVFIDSIENNVRYYYYIAANDLAGNIRNNSFQIISIIDNSTLNISLNKEVSSGVVSYNIGEIRNYVHKISGLTGLNNVSLNLVAKEGDHIVYGVNISSFNSSINSTFYGFSIDTDNTSWTGNATINFYISLSNMISSGANESEIFIVHMDENGTLYDIIKANFMGIDQNQGYMFNFTVSHFSQFVPIYIHVPYVAPPAPSSTGSTSSSGGGGAGGLVSKHPEKTWASILAYAPITFEITDDSYAFTRILFKTNKGLSDVSLGIKEIVSLSAGVIEPSEKIYRYIQIDEKNIVSEDLESVSFRIKVLKSWIQSEGIETDDVVFFRYDDGWKEQEIIVFSENEEYVYYDVISEGLSLFAIGAKEAGAEDSLEDDADSFAKDMSSESDTEKGQDVSSDTLSSDAENEDLSDPSESSKNVALIIGLLFIGLIVIACVVIFLVLHFRGKKNSGSYISENNEDTLKDDLDIDNLNSEESEPKESEPKESELNNYDSDNLHPLDTFDDSNQQSIEKEIIEIENDAESDIASEKYVPDKDISLNDYEKDKLKKLEEELEEAIDKEKHK